METVKLSRILAFREFFLSVKYKLKLVYKYFTQ